MAHSKLYSVLTGDVSGSSRIKSEERTTLLATLKKAFGRVAGVCPATTVASSFEIYRGDSFQGVLSNPLFALSGAIAIRATLKSANPDWDARVSVGIGTVEYLPEKGPEGDGQAYRLSGRHLDVMKGEDHLAIATPWEDANSEFEAEAALLDAVIAKWTSLQAATVLMLLDGRTQSEIGDLMGVSQAAIHYRTKGAGWHAVEKLIVRYGKVIDEHT